MVKAPTNTQPNATDHHNMRCYSVGVKEPNPVLSMVASIAIHALVVGTLLFAYRPTPLPEVVSLEASLMSGGDLDGAQAAIAKAYAANQAAQAAQAQNEQAQANFPTNHSSVLDDIPKPAMDDYSEQMSEKERQYQAQMQAYQDALDREIASEFRMQQRAFEDADKQRQAEVNALKQSERSNDDIARENSKELDEARKRIDKLVAEAQDAARKTGRSLDDGDEGNDTPTTPTVGRGGQVAGGTSSGSSSGRNKAIPDISARVQAIWKRYDNPSKRSLTATITIDDSGALRSVSFGAGDKDLQPSLEASIREAAPFPEMAGISRTFSIKFSTH